MEMQSVNKPTILIAEDNALSRELLREILQDKYRIIEAKDGQQAYDLIKENEQELSLILLDMLMPMKDGIQIIRELKQTESFDIPVIFVTAMQTEMVEEDSLKAGAVDYIRKPFDADKIKASIANHIKIK